MLRLLPGSTLFPYTTLFRSELRNENINLRAVVGGLKIAQIVKLDRDWFVMPGPAEGQPPIRLWTLTEGGPQMVRSEEHTSELQSLRHLVCRLLLEKKKKSEN